MAPESPFPQPMTATEPSPHPRSALFRILLASLIGSVLLFFECSTPMLANDTDPMPSSKPSLATLGGGCFWCLEAAYERFNGVHSVVSGYAGGTVADPTYKQVCAGNTGHAEVVQISFDPNLITYAQLLEIFWEIHDE